MLKRSETKCIEKMMTIATRHIKFCHQLFRYIAYGIFSYLLLTDIDECSPSSGINHGCQMKCNNNIGSYTCSCDKGYYLTSNGRDCSGK